MATRIPAPQTGAPEDFEDEEDDAGPGLEGQGGEGGDEGDEGSPEQIAEGEEEGEELDPDEPPAPPSRGATRFQRLSDEVADLRRENATLRGRSAPPAPVQPVQPQGENDEQFRARIALLAPHEQMLEMQQRSERRFAGFLQAQQLQQQDQLDRMQFEAKAAVNPRYKRYAAEVETLRTELQQTGQLVPRQVLLEVLIGRKVLANDGLGAGKGKGQQRQQAQRRVAAATTKPVQARGDVGGNRRQLDERTARAKRLENMQI
jgi:hypothetical protein